MENAMLPLSTRQCPAALEEQCVVVRKYQTILQIDTYSSGRSSYGAVY
jgi:hypothetical protein